MLPHRAINLDDCATDLNGKMSPPDEGKLE